MSERYKQGKKVSIISLISNVLLAVLKVIVGFTFSSKALVADGFHSVSDVVSTVIILMSIRISKTPPDQDHPYGHGKAESIATIILGLILIATGIFLIKDAVVSIINNQIAVPGTLVLWVAALSILVKELLYRYTVKIGREINSKGLIADAHHHRSDALSSIAALIGAAGARLGYPILDPVAGLVVSSLIIKVGVEILLDAIDDLMDAVPNTHKVERITSDVKEISGVITVGDIKLRSYGPYLYVDVAIVVKDQLTVIEGHKIAVKVREELVANHERVREVMVHVDPEQAYYNNQSVKETMN
ncbi:cation diffusion facilitator family transporter [Halanaerobacter jeridensis]|uniref:Cation diffusion facilitator family transporter n=1 Tax=Halanaerobacter jeridensis TaxID=706427 RepID=A0A939BQ14_9FIRM|nr:cation diffusion facilitator family transporter [Halanaerobacter jeridensis]MBM7555819.1 cation diffusion facilitator family transporter [Halanaerobacter jeridensis]